MHRSRTASTVRASLRVVFLFAAVFFASGGAQAQQQSATPTPAGPTDARNVYARGFMLQDRNADDVVDFVSARIVLPAAASNAEVTAAANIAARLGYETSAMNLDLVASDADRAASYDVPVIVIGSGNALASRARAGASTALAAGEGAISFITRDAFFRMGGVLVEGGDGTGLEAAAAYLSGRYPNVWGLKGVTYTDVAERLDRFLRGRGVVPSTITLDRIIVDADRAGVSRLTATVSVSDSAAVSVALRALRDTATSDSTAGGGRGGNGANGANGANADSARARSRSADIRIQDLHRLDVTVSGGGRTDIARILPARPWQTRDAAEFTAREGSDFTLSDLYSIRGLFRDTNQDLVPDRTDAYISLGGSVDARSVVNVAARSGLETAGMRLPFVRETGQDEHPESRGLPILFGVHHDRIDRLRESDRLSAGGDAAGEGALEIVHRGLDGRTGIVVTGGDRAGLEAISDYASKRMPWLWDYGKGNYGLSDVENEIRRFFQARTSGGQTALAGYKLRAWLDRLADEDIDSLAVEIATDQTIDGIGAWATSLMRQKFPRAHTSAATFATGFGQDRTIFTQEFDIPWEVDDFWKAFNAKVAPALHAGSRGSIEVRVSESPEVRAGLADEIGKAVRAKGADPAAFDIRVLSAYKQGYGWLNDVILPKLRGKAVGSIEIRYHSLKDSNEVRWQTVESDTRWLQEIYPIDAVFARELGIPDSMITFEPTRTASPVYTVTAQDSAGNELLKESFDPTYVVRPYFDLFPEYEHIRVTTGWVTAEADGTQLLDERIVTDAEKFWDILQKQTYAKIVDYVMDIQDGRPSPANAPYYDELRVDLVLSEPNYRIGVDEEVISSLEALHEDIYFETLTLFDLIGNRYGVGDLSYAGRVLPRLTAGHDGKPGHVKITFTGKQRGVPELVLTHRARGEEPVRDRYPLSPLPGDAPMLRGAAVRAGATGIERLLFDVQAVDSLDTYEQNRLKSSEAAIDRSLLSAQMLEGMVGVIRDLHGRGTAGDVLAFDRVASLRFRFMLEDSTQTFRRTVDIARSRDPLSTRTPGLAARGFRYTGQEIVQWKTPIPPVESDSILARLATFPGVNAYFVTKSFLGQNIFAADFLPPMEAGFVSQAKLNALKPTLFLSGRQHANEVSSTSHILRFGELLVTDSTYRAMLKKVNVVLHPITNADGARLAYEMQLQNPDFMLHAGYLGALGVDATSGSNSSDPIYPESKARPELQATWLPDIAMNLHGYPSHEWVQLFAGYSAWVRGRTGTQRSWWAPRGWFVPGFNWTEDPAHPEFEKAQYAILDSIAGGIMSRPDVAAMNRRLYARYRKYGRQDVENFRENFRNGILVYESLRGRPLGANGVNSPRVTYFSLTTEAPDETARGDWLELVANAGLAHTTALLRYLAGGQNRIEHETAEYADFVTRSVFRKKPVLPATTNAGGSGSR
jgi:Zinc carboxypeptidase